MDFRKGTDWVWGYVLPTRCIPRVVRELRLPEPVPESVSTEHLLPVDFLDQVTNYLIQWKFLCFHSFPASNLRGTLL